MVILWIMFPNFIANYPTVHNVMSSRDLDYAKLNIGDLVYRTDENSIYAYTEYGQFVKIVDGWEEVTVGV